MGEGERNGEGIGEYVGGKDVPGRTDIKLVVMHGSRHRFTKITRNKMTQKLKKTTDKDDKFSKTTRE